MDPYPTIRRHIRKNNGQNSRPKTSKTRFRQGNLAPITNSLILGPGIHSSHSLLRRGYPVCPSPSQRLPWPPPPSASLRRMMPITNWCRILHPLDVMDTQWFPYSVSLIFYTIETSWVLGIRHLRSHDMATKYKISIFMIDRFNHQCKARLNQLTTS